MKGMSHPTFTPQPQSITTLWPVLISHPADGKRLVGLGGWLYIEVVYQPKDGHTRLKI